MSSLAAGSELSSPSAFELLTSASSRRPKTPSGPGQMKVPVKLLPNRVDQDRVFVLREMH